MNYINLFEKTNVLDCGDNFCCLCYRQGGVEQLVCRSRYLMLFVLHGGLDMRSKYSQCAVEIGNIVVIDVQALTEFSTAPNTIVLMYYPPLRLEYFFAQCSKIYNSYFSERIMILPPLWEWINNLLAEHLQGKVWLNEQAHEQRRELACILTQTYRKRQLKELYAAFSICAMGNCDKCKKEAWHDNPPKYHTFNQSDSCL